MSLKARFSLFPVMALLLCRSLGQEPEIGGAARRIHDSALVIDAHADTPLRIHYDHFDLANSDPNDPEFVTLDRAKSGNLGAVFFSIFVIQNRKDTSYSRAAMSIIDSVYDQTARHNDRMAMAFSVADIERIHAQHKLAVLMGLEGGHCIDNNLDLLREFYGRGIRYMTLTHTLSNNWADSSSDVDDTSVQHQNGLSEFGRHVVLEMNRLGMLVDVSHVSDKTFWDVIVTTRAPVIASHSSARMLINVQRNMSDEMLRAMGKNDGVVNVAFSGGFIDATFEANAYASHQRMLAAASEYNQKRHAAGLPVTPDDTQRFDLEWLSKNPFPRAPLKSLIDHIDHIAKIAGIDHVGLGSDFNGTNSMPAGIDSVADYPKITQALLDRGYTAADIRKILGGNMLRVLREAERVAHSQQQQP